MSEPANIQMLLNGGKETVELIDAQNRTIFSNEKEQTIGTSCMWHWDESQRHYAGEGSQA